MTLLDAFKWFIDKTATAEAADIMQGVSENIDLTDYIKVDNNKNIVFVKDEQGRELKDVFIENINDSGLSAEGMGLTNDNLLEDIINAEIVTNYPYLGGDGLQGIVNFYRRDYDAEDDEEGTLMTYVDENKFKSLMKDGNWDEIKNVFTLEVKKGKSSGGKGSFINYQLTEEELRLISLGCEQEQGTPAGAAAEASLIANQVELRGNTSGKGSDLLKHLQGAWFGSATHKAMESGGSADPEIVEAVRSVLEDGKRTLPGYIDEHDGFGEFDATTDGVSMTSDRSQYVQYVTKISNDYGSNYTFYCFPDDNSDPFGYTSEDKRAEIGEFYYDFETGQPVNGTGIASTDEWCWPTDGTTITSTFGPRSAPVPGASTDHGAIDIGVDTGTNVYACDGGTVTFAGEADKAGILVTIDHGNGYVTKYMHNSEVKVSNGDKVNKGQVIALSGNTGNSSGPHLHFQVEYNGEKIDPMNFKYNNGMGDGSIVPGSSSSTIQSLDNFLFIGDSILGRCKDELEGEGAKVFYQEGANANFFIGKAESPFPDSKRHNCTLDGNSKFDWDANIGSVSNPNGIYLILGQNSCGSGASSVGSAIDDIKELVEKLQGQFSGVPIFINSVIPTTSDSTYSNGGKYIEGMKKANELLEEYCSSADNVTYVDTLDGYMDESSGYAKSDMASSDGLHPSSEGSKKLVENIKNGVIGTSTGTSSSSKSINSSTINLVIATYKDVDGKVTINREKINYQIETSKYATPVEFLIAHLQATNDTKYVKAIADMVINNSKINYVIQDQYTETTVKEYGSFTVNTYTPEKDENGNLKAVHTKSDDVKPMVLSKKVTKAISVVSYIRDADTWIVKVQQKYIKKPSGPTTTKSNEKNLPDEKYDASTGKQMVNIKRWTETTVYSVRYVPSLTMTNSTNTSGTTGSAVLGDNETANKIMTAAESQLGVPYVWGGKTTSGFDCSGLVQWCHQQAGTKIVPGWTGSYYNYSQYEVNWDDMQPGDVLWRTDHVGIYIGDGNYIQASEDMVKISSLEKRQAGSRKFTKVYRFW